jgi:hypothetical protein
MSGPASRLVKDYATTAVRKDDPKELLFLDSVVKISLEEQRALAGYSYGSDSKVTVQ